MNDVNVVRDNVLEFQKVLNSSPIDRLDLIAKVAEQLRDVLREVGMPWAFLAADSIVLITSGDDDQIRDNAWTIAETLFGEDARYYLEGE